MTKTQNGEVEFRKLVLQRPSARRVFLVAGFNG